MRRRMAMFLVIAVGTASAAAIALEKPEYVGSKSCKKCHIKQYKSWAEGKKAATLDILKPGQATESKEKHGLDPNKDYSTDESCLKCHATGFGEPGGYAVPDPEDKNAVKKAKALAGAGCESCHGPGSEYTKLHKEIKESKRTYKVEELHAAGQMKIDEANCTRCHNEKSPTYVSFDFATKKEMGSHEHLELKQREE